MDVIARIVLRYGIGFILGYALPAEAIQQFTTDPEIIQWTQLGLAAVAAGAVEGWYWVAKKMGWRT